MMVEFEGEQMRLKELLAKLEDTRACCRCGEPDPTLAVGACLRCLNQQDGYEACRADVVAYIGSVKSLAKDQSNGEAVSILSTLLYFIERGDADGFAKKGKESP